MPSEKRALDNDYDRSSKKPKREGPDEDQPWDWRTAYFDDGSSKRKHKDHKRSLDRDRQRDRSYIRPREKDHSNKPGYNAYGSSAMHRHRDKNYDITNTNSGHGAPPKCGQSNAAGFDHDGREEGYVIPIS
ncbi:hypothetical protein M408DRAFT_23758 [Serendipita vermifera MAFF 305830]|uniref:Uncharacterized protein n=1 Tax=Serendipita vermifera MAFF 305830 TaxID=933852 RepID=A0A0C3B898_SERVB|nr:hypothetical protein M408DRAFT_23758 [Serendipita vermifera MAFF 305830]